MAKNIFIAATEPNSGKSAISIGLIDALERIVPKVGYIKPIGQRYSGGSKVDADATLIKGIFQLSDDPEDMSPLSLDDTQKMKAASYDRIIESYKKIAVGKDIIVIEGTDYTSTTSALEFDVNAELATNLAAPVLLIANGSEKSIDEIVSNITVCHESFREAGCDFLGVVVNGFQSAEYEKNSHKLREILEKEKIPLFGILPYTPMLGKPRLKEVVEKMNAEVIYQGDDLSRVVMGPKVFSMNLENALKRIGDHQDQLMIIAGDQSSKIVSLVACHHSEKAPSFSGIMLTGGFYPGEKTIQLIDGLKSPISIVSVTDDTLMAGVKVNEISGELKKDDQEKINLTRLFVDRFIDTNTLYTQLGVQKVAIRTPKMFMYELLERAKSEKKRIVLPEGTGERILQAARRILDRGICEVTLLGDETTICKIAAKVSSRTARIIRETANIINPAQFSGLDDYIQTLYQMRKHRGVTEDRARDMMLDPHYFATMMLYKGDADGFVSGTEHSTAATIRPVLQIIKTREDVSLASSIFFMCLPDRVLVYGDCALVENPAAEQLADIALTSAETARSFGVDPYVAMLSYSTGESGKGKDVDKVKEATEIARKRNPNLPIEGPIQYDAAISPDVARTKVKDSEVAGKATVYIFPDLDSGNIAYKAVQRSANIAAIGPVLQGVNKPANDLSRGATVDDIVYTIAITAIQAQQS